MFPGLYITQKLFQSTKSKKKHQNLLQKIMFIDFKWFSSTKSPLSRQSCMIINLARSLSISAWFIRRKFGWLAARVGDEQISKYLIKLKWVLFNEEVTTWRRMARWMILCKCSRASSDVAPTGTSKRSWYSGTCFSKMCRPTGWCTFGSIVYHWSWTFFAITR